MVTMQTLTRMNIAALVLHIVLLLVVIGAFYVTKKGRGKGKFTVYREYVPDPDPDRKAKQVLNLTSVGKIPTVPLLIAFCVVTIAAHAAYLGGRNTWYSAAVDAGTNQWRYVEYGLSATIMTILLGALCGARTVNALVLLGSASVVMFICGALSERATSRQNGKRSLSYDVAMPMLAGFISFAAIWFVLGYNFFTQVNDSKKSKNNSQPPKWLWAVYLSEIVLFLSFGLVAAAYATSGDKSTFPRAEAAYIALSFAAKATLIGLVTGGLLSSS